MPPCVSELPPASWPAGSWWDSPATARVLDALAAAGGEARFVGGCVRDTLLGRGDRVRELDMATPLPPERVLAALAAAGLRAVPTGLAHGTVTAVLEGRHYEITTLRRDVACDGRHAAVAFTEDWQADAARRDFTINALYRDRQGRLYDWFGGVADLEAGRVRFVGDPRVRLEEDVLRLLRFFRFHAHYGRGEPDMSGLAACRALAPALPRLSGERVRVELLRLLQAPTAPQVWACMVDAGILTPLLPESRHAHRLARFMTLDAGGDRRDAAPEERALPRLAATLAWDEGESGAAVADAVADRLKFSRAERTRLRRLLAPPRPVSLDDTTAQALLLDQLGDASLFRDLLRLAAADASRPEPATESLVTAWEGARFPVTGDDLLAASIPPGPQLGQNLTALRAWWATQSFRPSRDDCLAALRRVRQA